MTAYEKQQVRDALNVALPVHVSAYSRAPVHVNAGSLWQSGYTERAALSRIVPDPPARRHTGSRGPHPGSRLIHLARQTWITKDPPVELR